ncbi:MAG: hypothetical protein LBP71_05665, partial [Spirochaetaceae bacterium]|nr:hypothetical protein [Spirochaetaceae bacterium]
SRAFPKTNRVLGNVQLFCGSSLELVPGFFIGLVCAPVLTPVLQGEIAAMLSCRYFEAIPLEIPHFKKHPGYLTHAAPLWHYFLSRQAVPKSDVPVGR